MTTTAATGAVTLVAIIRAMPGAEDEVGAALARVAGWVAANEPRTLAYHVSRGSDDPTLFTTFERFADRAAMEAHNTSAAVAEFVAAVGDKLSAPVELHAGAEQSALARQPPVTDPGTGPADLPHDTGRRADSRYAGHPTFRSSVRRLRDEGQRDLRSPVFQGAPPILAAIERRPADPDVGCAGHPRAIGIRLRADGP